VASQIAQNASPHCGRHFEGGLETWKRRTDPTPPRLVGMGHARRFLRLHATSGYPPKRTVKADVVDWQAWPISDSRPSKVNTTVSLDHLVAGVPMKGRCVVAAVGGDARRDEDRAVSR
jgi:hypothetical protein